MEDLGLDYVLQRAGVVPMYSLPLAHTQPEEKRGEHYQVYVPSSLTPQRAKTETPLESVNRLG